MEEAAPDFNVGAKGSSGPTEEWIREWLEVRTWTSNQHASHEARPTCTHLTQKHRFVVSDIPVVTCFTVSVHLI